MRSLTCDRSRSWISLSLDGALSELESVMLDRHLGRCSSCRAFAGGAAATTRILRAVPLEELTTPVELPGRIPVRRRRAAVGISIATAAAGLAAVLSLGPGSGGSHESARLSKPLARPAGLALISYDAANLGVRRRSGSIHVAGDGLVRGNFQLPSY